MDLEPVRDTLKDWGDTLTELIPNFALAAVVFVVFVMLSRLAKRFVHQLGGKVSNNKAVSNLLATIAQIATIAIGLSITLKILRLDGAATSILAGAGIAGVALGFAFQDIAANFISGVILSIQRPFKIGDIVETHETFGVVKRINLRSTEIETLDGTYVHIPNKDILLNPLIDYSHTGSRRVDLSVGVAYDTDLEVAEKCTIAVLEKLSSVDMQKGVDLYFDEFADSAITFSVRFWITFKKQTDYLQARSEAIKAIKKEFDKQHITIPFPVQTLELSSEQVSILSKTFSAGRSK